MQLIESIRRLLKHNFPVDADYHNKEVFIYPVLMIHDLQYDAPGFNYLLNHWFQAELQSLAEEGLFIRHVKPLFVVNIDSLIFHQIGLAKCLPLHKMLDRYLDYIRIFSGSKINTTNGKDENLLGKFVHFSFLIDRYFEAMGCEKFHQYWKW